MLIKLEKYLSIFFLFTGVITCGGQIVLGNFNVGILCCSGFPTPPGYLDTFDIDNDHVDEFTIQGISGLDGYGFIALGKNETELCKAVTFGNSFPRNGWNWYGTGLPTVNLPEDWNWPPNTGYKYLGFRRINAFADTTYGWVQLEFRADSTGMFDTLFVLDFAYSSIPNLHLDAGQTMLTNTMTSTEALEICKIYPNPFTSTLYFKNDVQYNIDFLLIDVSGKILLTSKLERESETAIDLSFLASGIYFLKVNSETLISSVTIVKR